MAMTGQEVSDALDEFAHKWAVGAAKVIKEKLLSAPMSVSHGAIPYFKQINRELHDAAAEAEIDWSLEEEFEHIVEMDLAKADLDEWCFHGDEGDGSQVWLCDGTCEHCKPQEGEEHGESEREDDTGAGGEPAEVDRP